MKTIRERDLFRFHYTDTTSRHMPYHCFDGKLLAFKQADGGFLLLDTYWLNRHDGFKAHETRTFTVEDALAQGELGFICNLDDVEPIDKSKTVYYDDADVFNLSYQHGCYPYFGLRKGAQKSPEKMRRVIGEQTEAAKREIQSAHRILERLAEFTKKLDAGQLDEVYL